MLLTEPHDRFVFSMHKLSSIENCFLYFKKEWESRVKSRRKAYSFTFVYHTNIYCHADNFGSFLYPIHLNVLSSIRGSNNNKVQEPKIFQTDYVIHFVANQLSSRRYFRFEFCHHISNQHVLSQI